jgi:hypothetical protein
MRNQYYNYAKLLSDFAPPCILSLLSAACNGVPKAGREKERSPAAISMT